MFESLFFQSLISFEFSFTDFDSPQTFLYVILWRTLNLSSQPDEQSNSFSEIPNLHWFDQHLCVRLSPQGPSPDTHVTVSSEDMLEVKKFPLLLQLLIKSNIFSNLSKLRNYTSSLIKITFRQIIE